MNDNRIISTISKIHFIIVSFFIFIFLMLTTVFIVLQNGLYIENISIPSVKIKQLYIKWNEKIDISIEKIYIEKNNIKSSNKFNYNGIDDYLKKLSHSSTLFNSITIEKILYNNISASFKYREGEKGFLIASSPDFRLESYLTIKSNLLKIDIKTLQNLQKKITIKGNILFNTKDIELYSKLHININNDLNANIFLKVDQDKLIYKLKNNKNIKNINYLVNLIKLPKEVKYWVHDAIDMRYITIENATGYIYFNETDRILKNIHIKATLHSLNYMYNPKLDAIHTKITLLEFKNGILYIYPKKAYSYGMYLNKSWIKIDFTKKEELLTLNLLFDGKLDKNTLKVLNTYNIKLPFLQRKGKVTTNLKIVVGLRTIDINAQGKFFTKKANFNYLGLNIDIYDALIKLDNYNVTINDMKATYKDIAKSSVNLKYNAHTAKGSVLFNAQNINFNNKLFLNKFPLKIIYNIKPNHDTISIEQSSWKYNNMIIKINPMIVPFNLNKLILKIPTTYVELENKITAFITGDIDIKKNKASFNSDILTLNYNNIKLNQSNTQLNIQYDKNLTISSKNKISFNINDFDIDLRNMNLEINDKNAELKNTYLNIDNFLYTKINASYNLQSKNSSIDLNKIIIKYKDNILYQKNRLKLNSKFIKDKNIITSNEVGIRYTNNKKEWDLKINSLKRLSKNSSYLQKLNITDGTIALYGQNNRSGISFSSNLHYPYKILMIDNKSIDNYKINGHIIKNEIYFDINDKIDVFYDKDMKINARNIGINIQELLKLNENITSSPSNKQNNKIILNMSNTYLDLGNNRKIISDNISLQYVNNILTAQLNYKDGSAGLKLKDKDFHLYGTNFNDEFMEKLLSLSKFKGGTLAFSINGRLKDYKGVFYIENTTILDYKVLNNILAFVNTIPSLVTFSLPGYNKNGLKVKTSYIKFNAKNGLFHVDDAVIDSKELDIFAKGVANLRKDTVDVTINLRTDLASDLSKIPIVGYVIFGKDSISTNMSITGKLSDPTIKSLLAKDIIVAPLNIVKRTVLLPFKLINNLFGDTNSSK